MYDYQAKTTNRVSYRMNLTCEVFVVIPSGRTTEHRSSNHTADGVRRDGGFEM